MPYTSRFLNEDAHFAEVPGCPLRGVREGSSSSSASSSSSSEQACARCGYNVVFPGEPQIGCHLRTPADVVTRARSAMGAALADRLGALRANDVDTDIDRLAWLALGADVLALDNDDTRELGSVILRFARTSEPVEILR